MEDSVLIDEVLELTLTYQRGDATAEERARLERLLADNPQAIVWYLRVVEDSLTLRASAGAIESWPSSSGPSSPARECELVANENPGGEPNRVVFLLSESRRLRAWAIPALSACALLAIVGALSWLPLQNSAASAKRDANGGSARVMNVSNVEWSTGAKEYDEWSFVKPGDSLKFERGLVNLFLSNGAELLIEGPADVDFVSLEKVFARKGKMAARVSPSAIGFSIETPHANVIDRGTSFGMSVDENCRTDVVVYEGMVDLDVLGDTAHPRRRLERGEALSVNRLGKLSRITTVQSIDFLEPPQVRPAGNQADRVITAVSDNAPSMGTAKYYRVIPGGFREDCRAYVDRLHEWNGVDDRGLPPFLVGGDYVMTFNDDKITTEIEIAVGFSEPATLYVIIDDRVPPPAWLTRDFVDTHWDVGSDDGWVGPDVPVGEEEVIATGLGPGESVDHACSIWRRDVTEPSTVVLGALSQEKASMPANQIRRSMYGVVATPLRRDESRRVD